MPTRQQMHWTEEEDALLDGWAHMTSEQRQAVASTLGRTVRSCSDRNQRLLYWKGQREGSVPMPGAKQTGRGGMRWTARDEKALEGWQDMTVGEREQVAWKLGRTVQACVAHICLMNNRAPEEAPWEQPPKPPGIRTLFDPPPGHTKEEVAEAVARVDIDAAGLPVGVTKIDPRVPTRPLEPETDRLLAARQRLRQSYITILTAAYDAGVNIIIPAWNMEIGSGDKR